MKSEENFLNKERKNFTAPYLCYHTTLGKSKVQNYRNELRIKSYDVDTNETFIVTRTNDKSLKPLSIVTTFVQSVHLSPAHKHEDGHATRQLHCQ